LQRVDVAERSAEIRPRPFRVDMNIEPHFAVVLFRKCQDFLMRGQCSESGRVAVEVKWIGDLLAIGKVADNQDDLRVARPNRLRYGF
jgi:hypothetical protein